ncbi:hypothetical protein HX13_07635 [Chryseobacterium sp. P1-3]|uniref:hypothetical protein n=1 Tax=Chryseobacterium sp. (strain P1-3) TaxID=1517683 RepID=UPI0004E66F8D|nr:hypothetical protein [Chryseobacterium sp. P1-3]KFF75096.1 hypothetical protein HX13_07635 [Chryseobacterium sp. P1-3]
MAFVVFFFNSCKDEAQVYDGESYLHFNKGTRSEAVVKIGSGPTTVGINFGTAHALPGAAQVKLVVDTSVSTAVEGTDFQIVNQNQTVDAGKIEGQFQVKLLEAGATVDPKVIVFKLQSSSVPNATFDQTYTLTYTKACPASSFVGNGMFQNNVSSWIEDPTAVYTIQDLGVTNNVGTFKVIGFMDNGSDLILKYNPDTYVVTTPEQSLGSSANGGVNYVKDASDGSKSTFNACTRTLKLRVNYFVKNPTTGASLGSYGDYDEVFTGQ